MTFARRVAGAAAVLVAGGLVSGCASSARSADVADVPAVDAAWSAGEFTVVAWTADGQLVEITSDSTVIANLGARTRESELDASGRWLSSAEPSSTTTTGRTLAVGPAGGELEVFAHDVVGARWHRTAPAVLAIQQRLPEGTSIIRVADFNGRPPTLGPPVDIGQFGSLDTFDEWGFALDLGGPSERSRLVGLDGSEIVGEIDGSVVGTVGGWPLLTGPLAVSRSVDPSSGAASPVDWIEPGSWVVAAAVVPGRAAFLVTGDGTATELVVVDADGSARAAAGGWHPALVWERGAAVTLRADGRQLVAERWHGPAWNEPMVIGVVPGVDATTADVVDFTWRPSS